MQRVELGIALVRARVSQRRLRVALAADDLRVAVAVGKQFGALPFRLRTDALRLAAREALPLVIGAACMLVLAAAIEAFWSPRTEIAPSVKYTVGGVLWLVTLAYFGFMGRARAA